MNEYMERNNISPREEYEQLKLSGYFGEWFPEYTWDWKDDCVPFLKWKGIIDDNMSPAEKLRIVSQHKTQEELQADWDEVVDSTQDIKYDWLDIDYVIKGYPCEVVDQMINELPSVSQTIYEALYCCDINDSSYATLSLHKTYQGAERAIENHKATKKAEFDDLYHNPEHPVDFVVQMGYDDNQSWTIRETELLD